MIFDCQPVSKEVVVAGRSAYGIWRDMGYAFDLKTQQRQGLVVLNANVCPEQAITVAAPRQSFALAAQVHTAGVAVLR